MRLNSHRPPSTNIANLERQSSTTLVPKRAHRVPLDVPATTTLTLYWLCLPSAPCANSTVSKRRDGRLPSFFGTMQVTISGGYTALLPDTASLTPAAPETSAHIYIVKSLGPTHWRPRADVTLFFMSTRPRWACVDGGLSMQHKAHGGGACGQSDPCGGCAAWRLKWQCGDSYTACPLIALSYLPARSDDCDRLEGRLSLSCDHCGPFRCPQVFFFHNKDHP